MLILADYSIKEQLYENERYTIYRAEHRTHQKKVIVKICRSDNPSLADLAALQHEYHVLKQLTLPRVIRVYDIVKHRHQLALNCKSLNKI